MTKAKINKNTSPKIGKIQNGISKDKGKTPDKKKIKEAAVKTPVTAVNSVTTPNTKLSEKKSKSKNKIEEKKNNGDYVTLELGDTKQPKVGKLTKAEKKKLKRARKREAAKQKEDLKNDKEEDDSESEDDVNAGVNKKGNDADEDSYEKETETDEEKEQSKSKGVEVNKNEAEETDDESEEESEDEAEEMAEDAAEEESDDESDEETEGKGKKESDNEADEEMEGKEETDSDSEPEEVTTEVKKKGISNKTADKKDKKKPQNASPATNSELTLSFKGFPVGTEEKVVQDFIHSAVSDEEIEHMFIARRRKQKLRGFGFIKLKTKEAFDKLLKLNGTEAEGKTIEVAKATFEVREPKKESEKRKHEDDQNNQPLTKKQRNQFSKSDEATLCVKNIAFNATEDQVREHFENHMDKSEIKQIRFPKKPDGNSKGFAFVEFTSQEALQKAKELNGSELNGRKLTIEASIPKNPAQRNSNDFSKFRSDGKDFRNNKNFNRDRKPFNKNKNFDGRNKNFNNKGKFGREFKGKGNRNANANKNWKKD